MLGGRKSFAEGGYAGTVLADLLSVELPKKAAWTRKESPQVVLASQPYGRGTAWAFTIQDSWAWQHSPDASVGKTAYRTFWRQISGALSATGPKP